MQNTELILIIIKLILGGIASFLAILLWSRTRDIAWMCMVAGTLASYAGLMYDMISFLGLVEKTIITIGTYPLPIADMLFTVTPSILYITAFMLMISRSKR